MHANIHAKYVVCKCFYVNDLVCTTTAWLYHYYLFQKGSTSIYHGVFWIKAIFRLKPAIPSLESLQILLNQFLLFVKMFVLVQFSKE